MTLNAAKKYIQKYKIYIKNYYDVLSNNSQTIIAPSLYEIRADAMCMSHGGLDAKVPMHITSRANKKA